MGGSETPARFAADCDYARSYDPAYQDALNDDTSATGDLIGRLRWDVALAPSESRRFWFAVGVYTDGEQHALGWAHFNDAVCARIFWAGTIVFMKQNRVF